MYVLLLFASIGMILLTLANDLIVLFVGLEIMSICFYILAGSFKTDLRSNEASIKYFLLGAFVTGFFLYGVALFYGMTGGTNISAVCTMPELNNSVLFYLAIVFIVVGFLFKVAAFPFHNWAPDVYSGAPTPLAGFMVAGSKMASFVALGSFLYKIYPLLDATFIHLILVISVCSMVYGNFVAARQKNGKRMLAYSSIAHSGYILLAACSGPQGFSAILLYVVVYMLMTLGAFGIISVLEKGEDGSDLEKWKGVGIRHPWIGIAMTVCMLSMAGIPPLAGFWAKYNVFLSAIQSGLIIPAILGILASVVGAYYYLRVILLMYFYPSPTGTEEEQPHLATATWPLVSVGIVVLLLIAIGCYPSLLNTFLEVF